MRILLWMTGTAQTFFSLFHFLPGYRCADTDTDTKTWNSGLKILKTIAFVHKLLAVPSYIPVTALQLGELRRQFECPLCRKVFQHRSKFIRHYKTHTEERPYPCPVCGEAFKHQWNMKAHLVLHVGREGREQNSGGCVDRSMNWPLI